MTAKKVKKNDKLLLENLNVGDKILDLHGEEVDITDDLIEQMRKFETETKKNSIYRGKITGGFLYFKWIGEHPEEKKKNKKPKKVEEEELIEEVIEEKILDEENLMLDCIADYKAKFNYKKVNTNTKKFKQFFEEWKQTE